MYPADNKIHGGANKVGRYLIDYFSSLNDIQVDIICGISDIEKPQNINEIISLGFDPFADMQKFLLKAKEITEEKNYDVILTSDLFPDFGNIIVHSHTVMYKNKNCKNIIERLIQTFLRRKKVKNFKKNFKDKNRKIFTVSKRLKKDYVENLGFDEKNVICVYPGVEQREKAEIQLHKPFTFGIAAGNAINKGGYLFLLAAFLLKLTKKDFTAKMIVSKSKKGSAIGGFLKFLKLEDKVEILPEQSDMEDFYNEIDCLVVPSINEAFGLVTTEAASYAKPTLISNTAGSAEIITDFENGFIFERKACLIKSMLNLYNKMVKILNLEENKYLEISNNAFLLSKKFLWNEYARQIAEALEP